MSQSGRIVVVGSLNTDLVAEVPRFPVPGETLTASGLRAFPGGKGANQAYAAARLGGRVAMVGCVGDDDRGPGLRSHLAAAGVDVAAVAAAKDAATGLAFIAVDRSGQNQIVIASGANGRLDAAAVRAHADVVAGAAVVLLQLEIELAAVAEVARLAHEAGVQVVLDPAPAAALPRALLAQIDWLTPNESELMRLLDRPVESAAEDRAVVAAARALHALGPRNVIVKRGPAGALWVGEGAGGGLSVQSWLAFPVDAVDTTAAGDAWNGAFAVALTEGMPLEAAARFANAAAALSVTRPGAQPSMPSRAEVDSFLRRRNTAAPRLHADEVRS